MAIKLYRPRTAGERARLTNKAAEYGIVNKKNVNNWNALARAYYKETGRNLS